MAYSAVGGLIGLLIAHTVLAGPMTNYANKMSTQLFQPDTYIETVLDTPANCPAQMQRSTEMKRFIRSILPHPALTVLLAVVWTLLQNQVSAGMVVFGIILGIIIPLGQPVGGRIVLSRYIWAGCSAIAHRDVGHSGGKCSGRLDRFDQIQ